jgi:hypothetical protein
MPHQIFDIAMTAVEAVEAVVQPFAKLDYFRWETLAFVHFD